jgi:RNA polymerase sigma-70 factor (ECF subfamily)
VDHRETAARLYREYGPVVYRRCLGLLRDREAAKDATQEVFVKLLGNMSRLEGREEVLPWIFRVATNHCLNLRRNAGRRGESELTPDLPSGARSDSDALPDRRLAQQILSRFDEGTQAVAVGMLVDGMERDEVASALGISRRTVSRRMARFLASTRRFLGARSP